MCRDLPRERLFDIPKVTPTMEQVLDYGRRWWGGVPSRAPRELAMRGSRCTEAPGQPVRRRGSARAQLQRLTWKARRTFS
jgi:hypothetical protein